MADNENQRIMNKNENNMDGNNTSSRIPKLRFPGFTGEWEEKNLGKVCDSILVGFPFKGQDITDDTTGHPILRAYSIGEGIIRHGKDYDKYYPNDSTTLERYKVKDGDIVISMDGSVGRNIAMVSKEEENYLLIQRVARLRIKDYPKQLIYQQVISKRFKDYATGEKVGAVIAHISQKQIESFPVLIPPTLAEQQKIASCLSELDNLITAQGQKVDALKEKKKGLMQQLFPQQGEMVPRLRFPGFEGEWDYVNGNELFMSISNKNHNSDLPILALTQDQGAVPREMINYNVVVSDKSVAGYKVVEVDDFIISLRSFQGGIEYSRYKGLCSPAYIVLRKKSKDMSSDFYRIYFKSFMYIQELNRNLEGIRDGKMISYQQFSEIKLPKPSPVEQQKIAECLSALDETIADEAEKLDALKAHKKGLMQQLFPQP